MATQKSPFIRSLGEPAHLELIQAGVLAPSPDNNQPWQFVSTPEHLAIHLDRSEGLPSDVNSMYDLMSVGMVIENITVAAAQRQQRTIVDYPQQNDPTSLSGDAPLVARLQFEAGGVPVSLHDALATRCTNRKLYSKRTPADDSLARVSREMEKFPEVQLDWVTERRTISAFARLVMQSDRFRFEYEPFHAEIFRQLRFTAEEAESTRDGLDMRTMALPPGAATMIRGLSSWRRMQWINRLGLGRLLTVPSWLSVRRSGALGVLSIPSPSLQSFVEGGRSMQRVWLALQAEDLAMCPLGSLPIFVGHIEQLGGKKLHAKHQELSMRLNRWFRQLVPEAGNRTLIMLFRTGYATCPEVRSLRRPIT